MNKEWNKERKREWNKERKKERKKELIKERRKERMNKRKKEWDGNGTSKRKDFKKTLRISKK